MMTRPGKLSTSITSRSGRVTPTAQDRTFGTRTAYFSFFASGSIGIGFCPQAPACGLRRRFSTGNPTKGIPNASSVNYVAGQTVANAVVSKVGSGGRVCLFTSASTDLVVDVTGYYPG